MVSERLRRNTLGDERRGTIAGGGGGPTFLIRRSINRASQDLVGEGVAVMVQQVVVLRPEARGRGAAQPLVEEGLRHLGSAELDHLERHAEVRAARRRGRDAAAEEVLLAVHHDAAAAGGQHVIIFGDGCSNE